MLTLASDFGSPYPAAMRAAIRRYTDAEILDIAHDFPRQDVRAAAFWLREVLPYAPPAVHCAVVDPGVGSDRAAIAVRVGEHAIVAPDNGLALPAARRLQGPPPLPGAGLRGVPDRVDGVRGPQSADARDPPPIEVFEIAVEDPASSTFHGRDVFAPAAALLHERGVAAMDDAPFLEPSDSYIDLEFPEPDLRDDGADGEVLVVDGFGNAITNVPGSVLDDLEEISVDGTRWPIADHYAAVDAGEGLVTVGSHGNVELAENQGRGDERFDVTVGDEIALSFE